MIADEQRHATAGRTQHTRAPRRLPIEPLITAAVIAVLLLGWQLVASSGLVPPYFVPTPRQPG